jgi:hypothetical protein
MADAPVARDKFPLHGTGNGKCGIEMLLNCEPGHINEREMKLQLYIQTRYLL